MSEFKVDDVAEQSFREGYLARSKIDRRIKRIADYYGFTSQANIAIEECSELIQAICKLRRGWDEDRYNNVKEEVADCIVICEQLRYLLGKDVDCLVDEKLSRQIRRIKKEQANEKS